MRKGGASFQPPTDPTRGAPFIWSALRGSFSFGGWKHAAPLRAVHSPREIHGDKWQPCEPPRRFPPTHCMMRKLFCSPFGACLATVLFCFATATTRGNDVTADFYVNSLFDTGTGAKNMGDFRYCLAQAAGRSVTIAIISPGTIVLTRGELRIRGNVDIVGLGAARTTVDGNGASRVFFVESGATVAFSDLTVANGKAQSGHGNGAGIFNDRGIVTIRNCTIRGNRAAGTGGGIFNDSAGGSAQMTIINSTVSGNAASYSGGGISNVGWGGSAQMTIINSTVSGNAAPSSGGGIFNQGSGGTATLGVLNSTISGNTSQADGGGLCNDGLRGTASPTILNCTFAGNTGGALCNKSPASGGVLTIGHTLFAGRSPKGNYSGLADSVIVSQGRNLSDDRSASAFAGVADLRLGPLAANGGPTLTHALRPDSPAIDAGDNALIPLDPATNLPFTTDQRVAGNPRILKGLAAPARVDLGAVEFRRSGDDFIFVSGKVSLNIDVLANDLLDGAVNVLVDSSTLAGFAEAYPNRVVHYRSRGELPLSGDRFTYQTTDGTATTRATVTIVNFLNYPGNLDGLVTHGSGNFDHAGYVRFAVTRTGVFSGMLTLGGQQYLSQKPGGLGSTGHSLVGKFNRTGRSRHVIARPPLAPLRVELQLDPVGFGITGTVSSIDGNGDPFTSDFTAAHPFADPSFAGAFTMLLELPTQPELGSGYAVGKVTALGEARIIGALPDGSRFSSGSFLHTSGIPFHAALYGNGTSARGGLAGNLARGSGFVKNATGTLRWLKPPRPVDAIHPTGFDLPLSARMFRYKVSATSNALESTLPPATADFRLGPGLTGEVTIDRDSRVAVVTANPAQAAFAFQESTGLLTGRFINPASGKITRFHGVALQGDERAGGFFLDPVGKTSGTVSIITQP